MYRFDKLKYIIIFLVIIFILVMTVKIGIDIKYKNDLEKIYSIRDNTFDNYDNNISLVKEFLTVYDIVDDNSYQNIKNNLYDRFSKELQKQYFSTANYQGLDMHSVKYEVIKIIGTNNDINNKNYFLIEYNLKGVNYNQNIINLIEIENGVISNIERLN